ncbi:MAG: hypothetical protein AB7U63_01765 [Porticoccaceae bacterium]
MEKAQGHDSCDDWFLELIDVVSKADFIRTKYRQVSLDEPVYSVDDYLEIISQITGYELLVTAEKWQSFHIRGGCLNFDNHIAKIPVAEHKEHDADNGVSLCEQRFITIKEAGQLVIDDDDSYIDEDCKGFVEDILFDNEAITDFRKPGRSDIFYGKIFAMELLFPWEYRDKAIKDMDSKSRTSLEIATKFMIPEKELIWFLSDRMHPALEHIHAVYESLVAKMEEKYTNPN